MELTEHTLEEIRRTLKPQEAWVIIRMREKSHQTLMVIMENDIVVHKERKEPIKD